MQNQFSSCQEIMLAHQSKKEQFNQLKQQMNYEH